MKSFVQIARLIVGFLFIISGFVKVVDPIGLSFKLEEYFSPQVLDIPFLMNFSLGLASFFAIIEIVLGIFLLLGVWRKFTVFALLGTIIFFTFLTFYSAYFNKVTDCGCFGDALKLEPWTSFYKDVVLLILILVLCFGNVHIRPLFVDKANRIIIGAGTFISMVIAYIGINHLPIIDFRPYAVGKNLVDGMKSAEELGLKPTVYSTLYTMKNKMNGEVVTINDKEYVADKKWYKDGTPWEMQVDKTRSVITQKGYEAPIHDFVFDCEGEDKTAFYLSQPKVLLFVIPFTEKINDKAVRALNQLAKEAKAKGFTVVGVSNNPVKNAEFEMCFMDQTTMKTIIRSNPGIVLIDQGVVKAKYHSNDLPTVNTLEKKL